MAKVPEGEDVNTWDPTDAVWFKIQQDSLVSGSSTAKWTSDGMFLNQSSHFICLLVLKPSPQD